MNADKLTIFLAVAVVAIIAVLAGYLYKTMCERDDLRTFKDRYRCQMNYMWRWFASDRGSLLVLGYLDHQLEGGIADPAGNTRDEILFGGIQAVRQAVRDSHFNDRCRGAAEAACLREGEASRRVPDEIALDAGVLADLRNAWIEGIDFDVFMAMGVKQLHEGRRINVITERRELLEGGKVAGISEPRLMAITNDLGERLWPVDAELYADGGQLGQPSPVQVTYNVVEPTVEEKVDEILKLMQQFGFSAQDGINIRFSEVTSAAHADTIAKHILSAEGRREIVDHPERGSKGERVARETLTPLACPVPSGWAVVGRSEEPGDLPRYLGPLEGWMDDPRRAVLFGNKEAAISAAATLNMVCPRDVSVVWMVYDAGLGNYVEQEQ